MKSIQAELNIRERAISDREKELDALISKERDLREQAEEERDMFADELSDHLDNLEMLLSSNLDSIPWLAGMMADYLTYDLEVKAKKLEWGK